MRTSAPTISKPSHPAPRVVPIRVLTDARGKRTTDLDNPDAMGRELVLQAVDRFEGALRFHELAQRRADVLGRGDARRAWESVVLQASEEVTNQEIALAFLIDALFNELAPLKLRITEAEEIERERTARGADRYIRRGIEVSGTAYVLRFDVGNMKPGIITRIASDRLGST